MGDNTLSTSASDVSGFRFTQDEIDKIAIKGVIERYAYAMDRRDVELMRSCFTSDADLSYLGGLRHYAGGDAFADSLIANLEPFGAINHSVSSLHITVDGDAAKADMHFFATMVVKAEAKVLIRGVGVTDEYKRTDSGWLISKRKHVPFLQYEVPTTTIAFPGIVE